MVTAKACLPAHAYIHCMSVVPCGYPLAAVLHSQSLIVATAGCSARQLPLYAKVVAARLPFVTEACL